MHVAATDGDSTHARSGVSSIAIAIDGNTTTTSQTCPTTQTSCSLAADRSVDPSSLAPGVHTVAVTVTDRAGNVRQDSWQFNLYPTSWHYGGTDHRVNTAQEIANLAAAIAAAGSTTSSALYAGLAPGDSVRLNTSRDHTPPDIYEINRPGYWVNDPNLFFDFGASDSSSGIRVLRTFAPAVPGWQGIGSSHMLNGCVTDDGIQCVGNAHVRSVVSNLPSGLQTIQVVAIDANGNETDRQFHLPVCGISDGPRREILTSKRTCARASSTCEFDDARVPSRYRDGARTAGSSPRRLRLGRHRGLRDRSGGAMRRRTDSRGAPDARKTQCHGAATGV